MGRRLERTLLGVLCGVALAASAGTALARDTSLCDPSMTSCRAMRIVNGCTKPIWLAVTGNSVTCQHDSDCPTESSSCDKTTSTCNCGDDSDCNPPGTSTRVCDTTASPVQCRYAVPLHGGVVLKPSHAKVTFVPDVPTRGQATSWGGRFWGRTGCPDFATCTPIGKVCSNDAECCTNAGCQGLFQCQNNTQCSTWSCDSDQDCPGGGGCDLSIGKCNGCLTSGSCACKTNGDCQNGGICQPTGVCTGQCAPGGISCETGDCGSVLECPVGTNAKAPVTLAEFTLLFGQLNYDTYDVSQVNGFNLPVKITPIRSVNPTPPNGFGNLQPWCGSPGCASAAECPGQSPACGWTSDFTSCLCAWGLNENTCPDPLQAVAPMTCHDDTDCGGGHCDTTTVPNTCLCVRDSDCPGITTCGINTNIVNTKRVCGTYVGCASSDDVCSADSSLKDTVSGPARFNCRRFNDLYGCSGALTGSCYTDGISSDCCGCPSWSAGGNSGPFPIAGGCQQANDRWKKFAEPFVETFKSSCPTAYSFQYDDPTSTFNCSGTASGSVGYEITFCPAGSPGAS